jgi:hypothetical protein
MDIVFCNNIYYYLCVDFRFLVYLFIIAKVLTNIKVIPYIIFHNDIYG